eukprot:TRINITY_DN9432_c0_g1_i1.p1 TRINITY_DN9432_c0_g1~~TRINITY_DN9432_c0_g1_i1.p1  ORF type:complete len:1214 (+),score=361.85 TRINITY_DN9432_c0_g1_i1:106-3642(+)
MTSNVRVVCRVRPMNDQEKRAGVVPVVTASSERKEVSVVRSVGGVARQTRTSYNFDEVMTSFSTQEECFNSTLEPLIHEVLSGYEATAFAYGQTGTGKTYTMEGDLRSEDGRGLVPRAAAALLHELNSAELYEDWSIHVSYLEIYNEDLCDLLAPADSHRKLEVMETGRGVCCQGLLEVQVATMQEILDLVHAAQEKRRVAETRMNERSSRSHTIFMLKVRCRRHVEVGELENVGKLHLVDLAGSECAKNASAFRDDREAHASSTSVPQHLRHAKLMEEERERRAINQSLLTLGRVIAALRSDSSRIPYRDSKLTRLLQGALGGRCKTVVIATISPALSAVEESISTLNYAQQASGIKNKPVATSSLKALRDPRLNSEAVGAVVATLSGSTVADMEMKIVYLQQEVEEAQCALARNYHRMEEAEKEASSKSAEMDRLCDLIGDMQGGVEELGTDLQTLRADVQAGSEQVAAAACGASASLEAMSAAISSGRASAAEHLEGSVTTPLACHAKGLAADAAAAQEHRLRQEALSDSFGRQAEASSQERQTLQSKLANVAAQHEADVSEQSTAMSNTLKHLGVALSSRSDIAGTCLKTLNALAVGLHDELPTSTQKCRERLEGSFAAAQSELTQNWEDCSARLRRAVGELGSTSGELTKANASEQVGASIGKASAELSTSIGAEIRALEAVKEQVSREVAELLLQKDAERALVSLLENQRQSLRSEVDELTCSLGSLRDELKAARSSLAGVRESQRQARAQALDAIMKSAASQLELMEEALEQRSEALDGSLEQSALCAEKAAAAARAAEQKSAKAGQTACEMVAQMGTAIDRHCSAMSASQESAWSAAEKVGKVTAEAVERHTSLRRDVAAWGAACATAATSVEGVSSGLSTLRSAQEAVASRWSALREEMVAGSSHWAAEGQRFCEQVGRLVQHGEAGAAAICELKDSVDGQRSKAEEHVAAAIAAGGKQSRALADGSAFAAAAATRATQAEVTFAADLRKSGESAAESCRRADRAAGASAAALAALEMHCTAAAEAAAAEASLLQGAVTSQAALAQGAQDVLSAVGEAANRLGEAHGRVAASVAVAADGSFKATAEVSEPGSVTKLGSLPDFPDEVAAGYSSVAEMSPISTDTVRSMPENALPCGTPKKRGSGGKIQGVTVAAGKQTLRVPMRDTNGTR